MVCLLAAPWVQLSVTAGNGWPHNALQHHWHMPISCHFRDCKAVLVTSLTHVSGAIASIQTFTFTFITFLGFFLPHTLSCCLSVLLYFTLGLKLTLSRNHSRHRHLYRDRPRGRSQLHNSIRAPSACTLSHCIVFWHCSAVSQSQYTSSIDGSYIH